MRIRSIKPELWSDARTGEWDARRTLFYVGLWQVADDAGRLRLDPRLIRAELDPFDAKFGGVKVIAELLEELVRSGRVLAYEAGGQRLGLVARFADHQVINKPTKSRLPAPPEGLREASGSPTGALLPEDGVEGKGREGSREQGGEQGETCAAPVVFLLKCSGKPETYELHQNQVEEWSRAYPGVDVLVEVRKASTWQDVNPTKRKTSKGMARFLVNWLGRSQDDAGRRGTGTGTAEAPRRLGPRPLPVTTYWHELLTEAQKDAFRRQRHNLAPEMDGAPLSAIGCDRGGTFVELDAVKALVEAWSEGRATG